LAILKQFIESEFGQNIFLRSVMKSLLNYYLKLSQFL